MMREKGSFSVLGVLVHGRAGVDLLCSFRCFVFGAHCCGSFMRSSKKSLCLMCMQKQSTSLFHSPRPPKRRVMFRGNVYGALTEKWPVAGRSAVVAAAVHVLNARLFQLCVTERHYRDCSARPLHLPAVHSTLLPPTKTPVSVIFM